MNDLDTTRWRTFSRAVHPLNVFALEEPTMPTFDLPNLVLPLAEAGYLLGYLKGKPLDRREVLYCVYRIADYAAEQVWGGSSAPGPLALHCPPGTDPLAALERELEKFTPETVTGGPQALTNIDWRTILTVVLNEVIKKLLGG